MVTRYLAKIDWKAYAVSTAAVAIAAGARQALDPYLGDNRPFLTFFAAVALSAWYGGLWCSIFTVALSYLIANLYFIPPYHALDFDSQSLSDWINLLSFLGISSVIIGSIEAMRRARFKAEAGAAQVRLLLTKAEEADRRKDLFLATLAHELRNPLAPLSNALQLWSMRAPDASVADLRSIMSRQVRQLSRLIDDLLDISRIKHGRIQLRRATGQLRPLIEGAIEAARPLSDHFGHQLRSELAEQPIWVDADPARLTQVFTNLLINAAKHSGTGRRICVSSRSSDGLARVSISDDGAGIPTNMLTKIFEPFAQAEDRQERFYAGLGIGLALVKQLVELHGGTAEAHSAGPGTGSEFIVTLPTVAAPPAADPGLPAAGVSPDRVACLPRHRIVVADDVVASATTLAQMLEALGQEVAVVHDGAEAIDAASTAESDMAVVDIAMPGLDGYEVARRLKAAPATHSMILVALTGYGQEHDRSRAFAAGFDHHLTKPVKIEDLQRLVGSLAARSENGDSKPQLECLAAAGAEPTGAKSIESVARD
jgi:signal transduction histidine kinase/ActR/RegA family two-component response regulator